MRGEVGGGSQPVGTHAASARLHSVPCRGPNARSLYGRDVDVGSHRQRLTCAASGYHFASGTATVPPLPVRFSPRPFSAPPPPAPSAPFAAAASVKYSPGETSGGVTRARSAAAAASGATSGRMTPRNTCSTV